MRTDVLAAEPAAEAFTTRVEAEGLEGRELSPADKKARLVNLIAVVTPFAGLLLAIYLSWGIAFDWTQAGILFFMFMASSLGITVGYHRLFTHKSFEAVAPVRWLLAVLGSMSVQGPVIEWVGVHRRHHQHSDRENDPHSPHSHDDHDEEHGVLTMLRGFYHAHMGWLFMGHSKGLGRYIKDLRQDEMLCRVNRQFLYWVVVGLVIPTVLGGVLTLTWKGALLGFLWGGLTRILLGHHIAWSVNSVCHLWGASPFRTGDQSRNNAIVGVLALGEGWHNNHHAFPTSARHGLWWWQFDPSYITIKALELVGLASEVTVPSAERIAGKRKRSGDFAAAAK